jgi:hypothetical protein
LSMLTSLKIRWFMNFDSKDRLVITCNDQIEIFY